ncbi:MAG TPA: AAA family ATPase [Anaerolineae bacterium]|nr:AAA family ATPase [Anaerolineae bacterium]
MKRYKSVQLVGRQAEIRQIKDFLKPLDEGRFVGTVAIFGSAGMGKSALVRAIEQEKQESGWQWLWLPANSESQEPLYPLKYVLGDYFEQGMGRTQVKRLLLFETIWDNLYHLCDDNELQDELKRTKPFLGALLGLNWEGSLYEHVQPLLRMANTFAALTVFLKVLSRLRPLVLVCEDIHWVDMQTAEFWQYFSQQLTDEPLALMVTARIEEMVLLFSLGERYEEIYLPPLVFGEIEALAVKLLGRGVDRSLVDLLVEYTTGNPLFIEQMIYYLEERALLQEGGEGVVLAESLQRSVLTHDLRALLEARLNSLREPVREVVEVAAVLGDEFEVEILQKMLPDVEVMSLLQLAEKAGIWSSLVVERDEGVRTVCWFRHTLFRVAAYEIAPRELRRAWHLRAAEILVAWGEGGDYEAAVAGHYGLGGRPREAYVYWVAAAKKAQARYENKMALAYYEEALAFEAESPTDEWYQLLLARQAVLGVVGEHERQKLDLERLAEWAAETPVVAYRLLVASARVRFADFRGAYEEAVQIGEIALESVDRTMIQGEGEQNVATLLIDLGWAYLHQGRFQESKRQFEQALLMSRQLDWDEGLRLSCDGLGFVSYYVDDLARAEKYYQQALFLAQEKNNLLYIGMYQAYFANVLLFKGDLVGAERMGQDAFMLATEIGAVMVQGMALFSLGWGAWLRGEFEAHIELLDQGLMMVKQAQFVPYEILIRLMIGAGARARGDYEAAAAALERGMARIEETGTEQLAGVMLSWWSRVLTEQEQLEEAEEKARLAVAKTMQAQQKLDIAHAWGSLGYVLGRRGEWDKAVGAYEKAIAGWDELGAEQLGLGARSGLAWALDNKGESERALAVVKELIRHKEERSWWGVEDVLLVYKRCYAILIGRGDKKEGERLKREAKRVRRKIVEGIIDNGLREQFEERHTAARFWGQV